MFINHELSASITSRDAALWHTVFKILDGLTQYMKTGNQKKKKVSGNCHSICRALAVHIPEVQVVDGYFIGFKAENDTTCELTYTSHSWLATPDKAIIEPYPVGFIAFNPVLIPAKGNYVHAGAGHYLTNQKIADHLRGKINTRQMVRETMVIARFMGEVLVKRDEET